MSGTNWGGWLPWNRRWQTEPVSLAEAAGVAMEDFDPFMRSGYRGKCRECGESYPRNTSPDGYSGFCTQVCVNRARAAAKSAS